MIVFQVPVLKPRQNNTIRSPAAASGVRSADGVVFPFQTGGFTGMLRFGLNANLEFVMNTRMELPPLMHQNPYGGKALPDDLIGAVSEGAIH